MCFGIASCADLTVTKQGIQCHADFYYPDCHLSSTVKLQSFVMKQYFITISTMCIGITDRAHYNYANK